MPRILIANSDTETLATLGEALDLIELGVVVLDRDLRVRLFNRRFAELSALPADAAPTLRELTGVVRGSRAQDSATAVAQAADRLVAAIGAGAIVPTEITLANGMRYLLQCMVRRDGGRVLTYSAVVTPATELAQSQAAQDAAEWLSAELRYSNETLEKQAEYLASLAEVADANARAAQVAKQELQSELEERLHLEARLRHMATIDGLTGAFTRGQFFALGQREVERVRERGLGLALLMIDVDHFKSINDRFGHPTGDAALRHLVTELRAGVRDFDLLGRVGGEEFAIVLPTITREPAAAVAERLRARVARHPFTHAGQQVNMTISIGLALLSDGDGGMEQLVVRADALLYEAKRAGRDRVVGDAPALVA